MAGALLSGVGAGLLLDVSPLAPMLSAWMALILFSLFGRRSPGLVFLYGSVVCVGWLHAELFVNKPSAREVGSQMNRPREYVTIRGMITADPIAEPGRRPGEVDWRFPVRVGSLDRVGHPKRASGTADVRWHRVPVDIELRYGQYWEMSGVLTDRKRIGMYRLNLPPYGFRVDGEEVRLLATDEGSRFVAFCYRMRQRCWDLLGRGLEDYPEYAGIVRALLLGYRHELPDEHHRLFATTGTLHIFAISGLHVGVVALLFIAVLKSFGLSRHHWIYYVAPLLIIYTVATGMRASAMRASVMALAYWSAFLFRRKPDAPSALAWAALLIVAAVPTQLAAPGFIYSFVIVAGLMRLYPVFSGPAASLFERDPWQMQRDPGWKGFVRGGGVWFVGLLGTSVAAWLSSAPLTAHYFNLFSPIALAGNVVVIPAAFLVVLTASLSLIAGTVWSVLAEIFNHANRLFLSLLTYFIGGMAQVPHGHCRVASPHWIWMALWYGVLFGGLLVRTTRVRVWALCGIMLIGTVGGWIRLTDRTIRMDVLDVGDGHATLIRVPRGGTVLYDAGPRYGSWRLIRELRRQGVNRVDVLVLSTPTAPYVGGALFLMEEVPVVEIWAPPQEGRSAVYRAVMDEARRRSIPVRTLEAGATGHWGDMEWEVLHPLDAQPVRRAADAALVMRVARMGASVMLMGGGGEAAETRIREAPLEPSASLLIYGNQGAPGTAAASWLEAVAPSDVVLSVGDRNRDGYPHDPVLARLEDRGLQVWRTDRDGVIRIEMAPRALRETPVRYHRILTDSPPDH